MARKDAKEAAKKKAAKQKKLLIFLLLVLVGALGFAAMMLMKGHGSPAAAATPPADTTSAPATGTPVSAVSVSPGIAPPPAGSLRSFGAFDRKDPFFDDGPDMNAQPTSYVPGNTGTIADAAPTKTTPTTTKPKQTSNAPTGAVIAINGKKFTVAIGGSFGHCTCGGQSLFKLIDVSAKTAVIAIVGSNQHWALYLGQPLKLQQQGGGEYKVTFLKVERN